MAASSFGVDERSLRAISTPCECHGLEYAVTQRRTKRVTWLPMTSQVSYEALRPLLELAALRSSERQSKLPVWLQRSDLDRVPLLRADRWIEEVSATLREPALGLLALANVQRGLGQVVELAAECADTLHDALLVLARHIGVVNEAASFHLHREGSNAVLVLGSKLLLSHALRDYLSGSLALAVARWLGSPAGIALWFAGQRPTYALSYRSALPDISVGFHAPCDALVVPVASLDARLPLSDPKLHDFLVRLAQRMGAAAGSSSPAVVS
jgi:Arabinose-binding domain of AraC transcription regulator, N-term